MPIQKRVVRLSPKPRSKQSSGQLLFSPSTLHTLFNHLPIGISLFQNGLCDYISAAAMQLFSSIASQLQVGSSLCTDFCSALSVTWPLEPERYYLARLHITQDQIVHVQFTLLPTPDPTITLLLTEDVTDAINSELAVQDMDKLLVLGELAAGMAHEIRNPLASLRGFTQMMQRPERQSSAANYLAIMLGEIDRMNDMIEDFLQLARPRNQPYIETDLIHLLNSVIILLSTHAILKSCTVKLETEVSAEPLWISCQPNKLKQVFINIVKNAIEATPAGSMVRVGVKSLQHQVMISVIDEGPGIPLQLQPLTGQTFFSTKEGGTGLGLKISQAIIRDHQGLIRIANNVNGGALVEILLPLLENKA